MLRTCASSDTFDMPADAGTLRSTNQHTPPRGLSDFVLVAPGTPNTLKPARRAALDQASNSLSEKRVSCRAMTSTSFFIFWYIAKRAHAPLGLWQFNDHSRKPGPGLGSIPSSTKFLFQSVGPEAPLKAHLSTSERGRPHTSARAFLFSKQSWDHNFLVDPLAEGAKPRQRFFKSAFFCKPLWKTLHFLQVYAVWLTKVPLCLLIGILPGHVLQLTFTVIMSWPPTLRLLRLFWAASLSFSPKPGRAKPTGASPLESANFFRRAWTLALRL